MSEEGGDLKKIDGMKLMKKAAQARVFSQIVNSSAARPKARDGFLCAEPLSPQTNTCQFFLRCHDPVTGAPPLILDE